MTKVTPVSSPQPQVSGSTNRATEVSQTIHNQIGPENLLRFQPATKLAELLHKFKVYHSNVQYNDMLKTLKEAESLDPHCYWVVESKKKLIEILQSKTLEYYNQGEYQKTLTVVRAVLYLDPALAWAKEIESILDVNNLHAQALSSFAVQNYTEVMNVIKIVQTLDPSLKWPEELHCSTLKQMERATNERVLAENLLINASYQECFEVIRRHPRSAWAIKMERSLLPIMEMRIYLYQSINFHEGIRIVVNQARAITGNGEWGQRFLEPKA